MKIKNLTRLCLTIFLLFCCLDAHASALFLSEYNPLSDAITKIGGTETTLLIDADVTMTKDDVVPAAMAIKRAFFVPATNSFDYYDFFSSNNLMYLAESKLSFGLIENLYKRKRWSHYELYDWCDIS